MEWIIEKIFPFCIGTSSSAYSNLDGESHAADKRRAALSKLREQRIRLVTKSNESVSKIRRLANSGQTRAAYDEYSRRKRVNNQINGIDQMITNLENLTDASESIEVSKIYSEAMKGSKNAIKEEIDTIDSREIGNIMSDLKGVQEDVHTMNDILAEDICKDIPNETYDGEGISMDLMNIELSNFLNTADSDLLHEFPSVPSTQFEPPSIYNENPPPSRSPLLESSSDPSKASFDGDKFGIYFQALEIAE